MSADRISLQPEEPGLFMTRTIVLALGFGLAVGATDSFGNLFAPNAPKAPRTER